MNEIYEFLKKCQTYYLATTENGLPKVRPFGTIHLFDGKLYIQTGKIKPVSKQMKENSAVEICAFDGQRWLRLSAKAILDDNREARISMLDAYPMLKHMYDADDGNTEVFFLTDCTAEICSFTSPKEVYSF